MRPDSLLFWCQRFLQASAKFSLAFSLVLFLSMVVVPQQVEAQNSATSFASGFQHSCAINSSTGTVSCWGRNFAGQLGNGTQTDSSIPVDVVGITNAQEVVVGSSHSCALLETGAVECWGRNSVGQLGVDDGTGTNKTTPVPVAGITDAIAIAAGDDHTCVILASGAVNCWGLDTAGQLGNGAGSNNAYSPTPVVGITDAVALAAGYLHTCAVHATGKASCWGSNVYGQLGDDTVINKSIPIEVAEITDAVAISIGGSSSCALLSNNVIRCWGQNSFGQLGDGTNIDRYTPVGVMGIDNAVILDAGSHTCAILTDNTLKCWGNNNYGQLGDETQIDRNEPITVPAIANASMVSVGEDHTCVLLGAGEIQCWGNNNYGQLGDGTTDDRTTPVTVIGFKGTTPTPTPTPFPQNFVVDIDAGYSHTCALLENGEIKCWGDNQYGRLGEGTDSYSNSTTPATVTSITNATKISAGEFFSCALLDTGEVQCWGLLYNPETPYVGTEGELVPFTITEVVGAIDIAVGQNHACALLDTGDVQCWGDNKRGQLGNTTSEDYGLVLVDGISNAVAISAGKRHTCALLVTGEVQCWGDNNHNQISLDDFPYTTDPLGISGISNAILLSTGDVHTCIVTDINEIYCWGQNGFGQLGIDVNLGTNIPLSPVRVPGIDNAVAIKVGYHAFSCALLATGETLCWGYNPVGNLGDGTTTNSHTPQPVSGLASVQTITAGGLHACALDATNAINCWGYNGLGELGDGTTTNRSTPVTVIDFEGTTPTPTPTPEPSPTETPTPSPSPSATPTPTATPSPSATPTPTPTPVPLTLSALTQFDQFQPRPTEDHDAQVTNDNRREIPDGGSTRRYGLAFRAQLTDSEATTPAAETNLRLEIEVQPVGTPFTDTPNLPTSDPVFTGATAEAMIAKNPDSPFAWTEGDYKWQARIVKTTTDTTTYSPWTEYETDTAEENDFTLDYTYRVAVIMAETSDQPHTAISPDTAPCKLPGLSDKTYTSYDSEYFTDLMTCVESYYNEVSMGAVRIESEVLEQKDANGNVISDGWVNVQKARSEYLVNGDANEADFIEDAFANYNQNWRLQQDPINPNDPTDQQEPFDMVMVYHVGEAQQTNKNDAFFKTSASSYGGIGVQFGQRHIAILSTERDRVGVTAHELTHLLGYLAVPKGIAAPDLYDMGLVNGILAEQDDGEWALMSSGSSNGDGTSPPHMISYVKDFFGWLTEDIYAKSEYGLYSIRALPHLTFGDHVVRYNLSDDISSEAANYYLFETRHRDIAFWDTPLPPNFLRGDDFLLLYLVNTNGVNEYTGQQVGRTINLSDVLDNLDDSFYDADYDVHFTRTGGGLDSGNFNIPLYISEATRSDFIEKLRGPVLKPNFNEVLRNSYLEDGTASGAPPADFFHSNSGSTPLTYPTTSLIKFLVRWSDDNLGRSDEIALFLLVYVLPYVLIIWGIVVGVRKKNTPRRRLLLGGGLILLGSWIAIAFWYEYNANLKLEKEDRQYRIEQKQKHYEEERLWDEQEAERLRQEGENQNIEASPNGAPPYASIILPDTDLHAITPDGRHVGVNYETGEFENEIEGSIVSGDLFNDHEWILVPEDEEVTYYVSSQDTAAFLEANPDIAATLTEAEQTETYEIYAKSIDPDTGIFRSESQTVSLQPGEKVIQTVTGGENPTLSDPVTLPPNTPIDLLPPTTSLTLDGTESPDGSYTPGVTVTLIATDETDGSGIAFTEYSLDDGATWTPYTDPIVFNTIGEYTLLYRSTDNADNIEADQSETIVIALAPTPTPTPTPEPTPEPTPTPTPTPNPNLLTNAGFETDGDWKKGFWTSSKGTITRTTATKHSGSYAYMIDGDTSSSGGQVYSDTANRVPVTPGTRYQYSAWYKGNNAYLVIKWFNSSGTELSSARNNFGLENTSTWTKATKEAIAPTGATKAWVFVQSRSNSAPVYFDDLEFFPLAAATPSMVFNPSFETQDGWLKGFWTSSKGTIARVTSTKHSGSYSYMIDGDSSSSGGQVYSDTANKLAVTPGTDYRFSAWYQGKNIYLVIKWLDANGNELTSKRNNIWQPNSTSWRQAVATVTAPQGATKAWLFVQTRDNAEPAYFDDLEFEAVD